MDKSFLKYMAALLLFGSNGIVAGRISLSSHEIVLFRTMIGSALLIALYLIYNKRFTFYRYKKSAVYLWLSGFAMGVSWLFLYEAYKQVGVSVASLGYYCGPIIVMALSPFLFKEKLTKRKLLCFLVVFVGIVFVDGNAVYETHNLGGIAFALLSAVMYAVMLCFSKKVEGISGMENATVQLTAAFVAVFVFVAFKQGLSFDIRSNDIAPLLVLGLLNTGIGCFLYFSSIGGIKVQTVALIGYIEPLSAIFFSFIFLHEQLLVGQIIGAVLIISGALCAELRPKAHMTKQ